MGLVAGIIVAVVVLFFIGYVSFPFTGASNTGNDNIDGCAALSANLRAKRVQTCGQRSAVATARAMMVAAGSLYAATVAASLALSVVAAVAAAVPIIGPLLAAAAATAAAAAAIYSIYLLGRYAAAITNYATQSQGLNDAMRLEAEALQRLTDSCPADTVDAVVASLPVCAV